MDKIKTLFVEDDPDYALLVKMYLIHQKDPAFEVVWVDTLGKGLELLAKGQPFDIILADLNLPDSSSINTFWALQQHGGTLPVVVVTAFPDEKVAMQAVRNGAQDYLVKGDVTGKIIARVLVYALQRHKMQEELKSLALTDELTGLGNRRAFVTLAQHHIKLSQRTHKGFWIFLADLDGLKKINDGYGHAAGDQALVAVAQALLNTFRQSDVVARIGGDEFAVLAVDAEKETGEAILARLEGNLARLNGEGKLPFPISLSIGTTYADPESSSDLNLLFEKADQALYRSKCSKRGPS
jgi:diguanylate cyclase (GGDEF)-like protein